MLNTYVNHGNAMHMIVASMKAGRKIEAIKEWRALYGVGLKEAKDAVEAIADAFNLNRLAVNAGSMPAPKGSFMVFSRHKGEDDFSLYPADDEFDARDYAHGNVSNREEMFVVRVLAKSVTTRSMQNI
jgi:hypothetical protein